MTIAIEKQIKQETVFSGKVLRVTLDTVRINDTTESFREVVHHMVPRSSMACWLPN